MYPPDPPASYTNSNNSNNNTTTTNHSRYPSNPTNALGATGNPSTSPTTSTSVAASASSSTAMPPPLGAAFAPPPAPTWYPTAADAHVRSVSQPMNNNTTGRLPVVINIFDVSPQQGYEGTPISITCDLKFPPYPGEERDDGAQNQVRLIFGNVLVPSTVAAPSVACDNYIVQSNAPPLRATGSRSWSVPVRLEAINQTYGVLEVCNLGDFHYLGDPSDPNGTPKRARTKLEQESPGRKMAAARGVRRRHEDEYGLGAGGAVSQPFVYDSPPQTPQQPGLVRTTQMVPAAMGNSPFVIRTKARLEIEGDLSSMKANWSQEMWKNGRCLVEFHRRRVEATVHASFRALEEKDWAPNMIVISCLYHHARQDWYFTSVDAIYLLECLMETRYTTEEKNRIRRNLESFKPTTLQKNEGQWQDFYAHIMNYPNPKPRNIDKGLKVFPWAHLEQALKKIFGNYSAYLNTPFNFSTGGAPPMDTHAQQVMYGHHHSNSMAYTEDRGGVVQPASLSVDDLAYSGMGASNVSAAAYRTTATGGSAQTSPPELMSPYGASADGDFNNYVNMSPVTASTATMPRDSYPPQLGLYVPNSTTVDPLLPNGHPHSQSGGPHANGAYGAVTATGAVASGPYGGDPPLPYAHVTGSRTPSNSDLRVAYEQHPPPHSAQYPQQ